MKRLILIAAFLIGATTLSAQNYIIVNSEEVFTSIDSYNAALDRLNTLSEQYQERVDAKFAEVEALFNAYTAQRASLTAATRQARESAILAREQEALAYQESLFGQNGSLMQKRLELIQPIQQYVFSAIEGYAAKVGADMVIDSSNNPTLLYVNPNVIRTEQVIELLKSKK